MKILMPEDKGEKVFRKRFKEGLTQKQLSEKINIPARIISSIERSEKPVKEEYIIRAYKYIGESYNEPILKRKYNDIKRGLVKCWKKICR